MDDDTAQAVPFLDSFWALATPVPHERSQAAASLAMHLADDAERSPYALKRLCRGLCSPRPGARQGFGAALIEVLCVFERQVTVESVLELMNNSM